MPRPVTLGRACDDAGHSAWTGFSAPTTLDEIGEPQRRKVSQQRAITRAHVWSLIAQRHGQIPPSRVADRDLGKTIVIRTDASLVIAHSDKQMAAGTYKGSWGHHPLMAWCDNTGESLALKLRKGSAGSNTVSDHVEVLEEAITQIPARYRRNLLITLDGAGASHGLIDHITNLNASPWRTVQYSTGWNWAHGNATPSAAHPSTAGTTCSTPEGAPRDLAEAGVIDLTALLREGPDGDQLANWPQDLRIIARREKPHPGAQLSLFEEIDGWRYQLLATNTPGRTAQSSKPATDHTPAWKTTFAPTSKLASDAYPPPRIRSTQDGNFVAQYQDLNVLGPRRAAEQQQQVQQPQKDQVT